MIGAKQEEALNVLNTEPDRSSQHIPITISIELSEQEKLEIDSLLISKGIPGRYSTDRARHFEELTDITRQVKCIAAQSILLHGERIKKAQEILADYREGGFTMWLKFTYGNTKTPYSILGYYEFYQRAPTEFRAIIESAPKKCIYNLAARTGDNVDKLEFIKEHGMKSQSDILQLIQKKFPTRESDKRRPKSPCASTFKAMEKFCEKLEGQSDSIAEDDRATIQRLIERLQKL